MANGDEFLLETSDGERRRAPKRDDKSETIQSWVPATKEENNRGERNVAAALEPVFLFRRDGLGQRRVGRVRGELRGVGQEEVWERRDDWFRGIGVFESVRRARTQGLAQVVPFDRSEREEARESRTGEDLRASFTERRRRGDDGEYGPRRFRFRFRFKFRFRRRRREERQSEEQTGEEVVLSLFDGKRNGYPGGGRRNRDLGD